MTEPDVPTVITQLRTLAAACRNLNDPYGGLPAFGVASVADQLQGWTLVKLPESDVADADRWYLDGWDVEAGTGCVVLDGEPNPVEDAHALGLALLAAVEAIRTRVETTAEVTA